MTKSLIKKMKERIAQSGTSAREVLYFAADSTKRVRFLNELDAGYEFQFHSNWEPKINTLCKDPEDHENCELCQNDIALISNFAWSVWDYDSNSVRILLFKANGISPVPSLIEMYEEFGTIMDRDYKIKKVGKGMGGSFVVTPLDKSRFKNTKAKPYTESQMQDILDKAFPYKPDDVDEDDSDEEENEKPRKKSKGKSKKSPEEKLRNLLEELDISDLRKIGLELGLSKKEMRGVEEDELIDEFVDNYELEDVQDAYDSVVEEEDEDDEE